MSVDVLDRLSDVVLDDHVQSDRRLVEKKHLGTVQQRGGDIRPHTLTEGERADRTGDKVVQLKHLVEKRHALFVAVLRHLIDLLEYAVGLPQRQIPPELRSLTEHDADLPDVAFAVTGRVFAVDGAAARGRREDSRQHFDDRALSGAVWPDKAENLALRHLKADIVNGDDLLCFRSEQRLDAALESRVLDGFLEFFSEVIDFYHSISFRFPTVRRSEACILNIPLSMITAILPFVKKKSLRGNASDGQKRGAALQPLALSVIFQRLRE